MSESYRRCLARIDRRMWLVCEGLLRTIPCRRQLMLLEPKGPGAKMLLYAFAKQLDVLCFSNRRDGGGGGGGGGAAMSPC